MQFENMTVGRTVIISDDIDIWPLDIFEKGLLGVVIARDPTGKINGEPSVEVRLEKHFDSLNEWDNVLYCYRDSDVSSCLACKFEPLPEDSTADLTRELELWSKAEGLPYESADEMAARLGYQEPASERSQSQLRYLFDFIDRWEVAQRREDNR
jgi:hypothetical protein